MSISEAVQDGKHIGTVVQLKSSGKSGEARFEAVIDRICALSWERAEPDEILQIAKVYYYFSIQFRENLEIACALYPRDGLLAHLYREECNTDNLSPWPGVAAPGEHLDHDEFMRRLLDLQPIRDSAHLDRLGEAYLRSVRAMDDLTRAKSIASYENEGLSRVFTAILRAPCWDGPGQSAFRFFLERHIEFDTDDDHGHGALSRHLTPDDRILPLWAGFEQILRSAAPNLAAAPGGRP